MEIDSTIQISGLIKAFQKSLCALALIADELGIRWREPNNYDEWDIAANGIFRGFVIENIHASNDWRNFLPILGYDLKIADYSDYSFVAVRRGDTYLPFYRLDTRVQAFDTCVVAVLDTTFKLATTEKIDFAECEFLLVANLDGTTQEIW